MINWKGDDLVVTAADIALVISLPVLGAASAVCSGSETVLFSLSHSDRVRLRKLSPAAARDVAELLSKPRRLLILILILNVSVNALFFVVSSVLARRLDGGPLAIALSVGSVLGLTLLGEVIPKSLAAVYRVRFATVIAPLVRAVGVVLRPLTAAIDRGVVRPTSLILRPIGAGEARHLSVDELSALLEAGADSGLIDEGEQRLLSDVVGVGTLRVKDVMTPRVAVAWLDERAGRDEILSLVRKTGHTKFPVCRGGLDGTVLGLVNAKVFLSAIAAGRLPKGAQLGGQAVRIPCVPDRARLDQLLDLFRHSRAHVALCVDEFGVVTGLIEAEDVVRQMVRPTDAIAAQTSGVERLDTSRWSVPGRLSARHWAEFFEFGEASAAIARADREASTVAGLILCRLGRVPQVGDQVILGNITLRVAGMSGRVIERVEVVVREPAA